MAVSEHQRKQLISHFRTARTLMLWVAILLINLAWPEKVKSPADRLVLFHDSVWVMYMSVFYLFGVTAWRVTQEEGPVYYASSSVGVWVLTVFASVASVAGLTVSPGVAAPFPVLTSVLLAIVGFIVGGIWVETAGKGARSLEDGLRVGFLVLCSGLSWSLMSAVEGAVGLLALVAFWATLRVWIGAGYEGSVSQKPSAKDSA